MSEEQTEKTGEAHDDQGRETATLFDVGLFGGTSVHGQV